jgi:hypothetical protein
MPDMDERDWRRLLERIKDGKCTPFLGAGACAGVFPTGSQIAQDWAQELGYPSALEDTSDLAHVAQFVAVTEDSMSPKEKIQKYFQGVRLPNFFADNEPHGVLAELPFPIYITTNYDDCMTRALKSRDKDPIQEICRWNSLVKMDEESIFKKEPGFKPTPARPIVFHLHGHLKTVESLVLTEDDYLDFLVMMSKDDKLLPSCILLAMAGSSLLFLGYRIADWDFRVLFRSIVSRMEISLGRSHVSVQLAPGQGKLKEDQLKNAQQYLVKYYGKLDIRMYWGECSEFAAELKQRWEEYKRGS